MISLSEGFEMDQQRFDAQVRQMEAASGEKEDAAVYGAVNYDPSGKPRIGDWIQTHTGVKFHLMDPRPEDFVIEDIAHALANQCRFTGHVREFYSIAEHSVRVAEYVSEAVSNRRYVFTSLEAELTNDQTVYAALMHDASEAYMTDVARPFKRLPEYQFYREIEDRLMGQIARKFRFAYPLPKAVKDADEILLGTEARDLMHPVIDGWHFRYGHLKAPICPWSPRKAKRRFLDLFYNVNPLGIRNPKRRLISWAWQPILAAIRIANDPRFD